MSTAQLSIIPFVLKSKNDLAKVSSVIPPASRATTSSSVLHKRPIGSLHYRTRSFRSFKLPRKLKRGTLLKQRVTKNKGRQSASVGLNRKQRRRKTIRTYGLSVAHDISFWDTGKDFICPMRMSTHVWHRKRFIMANRHGVLTAMRSSYHGFKAIKNYKKIGKVFVHDHSYLSLLELFCNKEEFLGIFRHITDESSNLYQLWCSFKHFQAAEYSLLIYEPDTFPLSLIGPVKICIRNQQLDASSSGIATTELLQVWTWCEPSIVSAVFHSIQQAIGMEKYAMQGGLHLSNAPISRISLIGKNSTELLRNLLLDYLESSDERDFFARVTLSTQTLNNAWKNGKIVSLMVSNNKQSQQEELSSNQNRKILKWPIDGCKSTLWDTNELSKSCIEMKLQKRVDSSESKDNKSLWNIIQKQLQSSLSGERIDMVGVNDQVTKTMGTTSRMRSILLVRHHKSLNVQSIHERVLDGWTIILHSMHATDLMTTLAGKGAVAIGVEELEYLQMMDGVPSFPRDFLDSLSGQVYWKQKNCELERLNHRRPIGKRQVANFSSITMLMRNCTETGKDLTVVRNYSYLEAFSPPASSISLSRDKVIHMQSFLSSLEMKDDYCNGPCLESLPDLPNLTFAHMSLKSIGRGLPKPGATIFAPNHKDLMLFAKHHLAHKKILQSNQRIMDNKNVRRCHESSSSKRWQGVNVNVDHSLSDRVMLGVVTSGHHSNCNRGHLLDAIAFCDVEKVYNMASKNYELFGHPLSHKVVLFLNPGSNTLRPGYMVYL